jgi:excisionase family DNA binding protein
MRTKRKEKPPRQDGLTIPQLADKLGISRIAVWNKVRRGQIPATKVGRQYIVSARDAHVALGEELSPAQRRWIRVTVRRAVRQYGEVLKRLSHE